MPDDEVGIRIKIKEAAKAISEIGAVKSAIASVGSTAKKSTSELSSMSSQGLSTFSGIARGVKTAATNLTQYSAYAAVAGAAGVGFGLKTAGSLEQTNVAFKRMLGSQELATTKIKELQAFAIASPYDFQTIIGNARTLIAKGFDPGNIVQTMTSIGDAVASIADPSQTTEAFQNISYVLGQLKSGQEAINTIDVRQFANASIDAIGYLSEAAGKTRAEMKDLVSEGVVPAAQAADVILKGMSKQFGGMMEAQNKTMLGQISAVKDKIKADLYKVEADGRVTGTLAPLVMMIERNLPRAAIIAGKGMEVLGRGVKAVTDGISDLAWFYKMGGVEGLLGRISSFLPFGINLVTIWRHLTTDSKNLAAVWSGSLWPSIKNVAIVLAPLVFGTLAVLEGTLSWMADHPTAAAIIFTTLGLALAEWAIIASLVKIYETIKLITIGFAAAQVAVMRFGATSASVAWTGAAAMAVPNAALALGETAAVAGGASTLGAVGGAVAPAATTAAVGGGLGLAGGIAAGGAAIGYLGKNLYDTYGSINKHFGTFGRFASGGTQSMSGWASINEDGDELVKLPGGSKVTNNKDFASMLKEAGKGTSIVFGEGSLQVSGFNFNEPKQFADLVIGEMQNRIARG